MRDLNINLTEGKNSTKIQSKKTKSFGYQVLGFGAGGGAAAVEVEALVIAGGGAGTGSIENSISAGGGGAGGYRFFGASSSNILELESGVQYTVTVGGGGS